MGIYKPYSSEREETSLKAEVLSDTIELGKYSEDLKAFLDNLKPDKGKVYLLVNAMGAGEFYGSNKNGDLFPERALIKYYPTFYNAKVYKHHINKEEKENYGDVVFAGWNPRMKRIELVISIDLDKSPEIGEKIKAGIPIGVSMGTRVPEEICSICGARPRKIEQRCDHLKYHMGKVLPDGRKVYAINEKPSFFDISLVIRPADETAYALKKVASDWEEKPQITIEEELPDEERDYLSEYGMDVLSMQIVPFMELSEKKLPNSVLNSLAKEPLEKVCCTATSLGIVFKPEEWQRMHLVRDGMEKLADECDAKNIIMAYPEEFNLSDNEIKELYGSLGIENYSSFVSQKLKPYFEHRTFFNPMWANRLNGFTKLSSTVPGHMVSRDKKYTASDVLIPAGLSYLAYRFLLGKSGGDPSVVSKIISLFKRSPLLSLLLLGAGAKVTANALNTAQPYTYPAIPKGLRKTSGVIRNPIDVVKLKELTSSWWKPLLVAFGGAHLWAAESKRKEKLGVKPGVVSNFITESPNISAILGAIALRKGMKALGGRNVAKGLTKTSTDQDLSLQNIDLGLQRGRSISKIDQFKLRESLGVNLINGSLPESLLDQYLFKGTAELLSAFSSGN